MALILRKDKGAPLTYSEMDDNLEYLDGAASGGLTTDELDAVQGANAPSSANTFATMSDLGGGGDEPGTNYILIKGTGTPAENGLELEAAYVSARGMSPAIDNVITLVVYPGEYSLTKKLLIDIPYVNITSLTGAKDVFLDRGDQLGDPYSRDSTGMDYVYEFSYYMKINTENVHIKGISGKLRQSPNWQASFNSLGSPNYRLSIEIGSVEPNVDPSITTKTVIIEDSLGGPGGFSKSTGEYGNNIKLINCEGDWRSFHSEIGDLNAEFIGCVGAASSFQSKAQKVSGIFTDCVAGFNSFRGREGVSGVFTNIITDYDSFSSYDKAISGTFVNCVSGEDSYDTYGAFTAKLYNCRLTAGTFPTVSGAGRTYYCVDGDGVVNNQ